MPVDPTKNRRLAVNLPIDLADKVDLLARYDRRTVAQWLRLVVEDRVNERKEDVATAQALFTE